MQCVDDITTATEAGRLICGVIQQMLDVYITTSTELVIMGDSVGRVFWNLIMAFLCALSGGNIICS